MCAAGLVPPLVTSSCGGEQLLSCIVCLRLHNNLMIIQSGVFVFLDGLEGTKATPLTASSCSSLLIVVAAEHVEVVGVRPGSCEQNGSYTVYFTKYI